MTSAHPLLILTTGGTLDKIHDPHTEALAFPPDGATHVPAMLERARCHWPRVQPLLMKDSLDFTDADRDALLNAIAAAPERAIVVTHGTGTMELSARWVAARLDPGTQADPDRAKTVVFTGAMRPHSLGQSDAQFNLGGAVVAAQCLPAGVYGVMNGRVFPAAALHKNTDAGRFDL